MKWVGKILIVLVVVVVVVFALGEYDAYRQDKKQKAEEQAFQEQIARQERDAAAARPGTGSTRPGSSGASQGTSQKDRIYELAKECKVQISGYSETHGGAMIDCWARDKNFQFDFIDALVDRNIIRDIDLDNTVSYGLTIDKNQQSRWRQKLAVRW